MPATLTRTAPDISCQHCADAITSRLATIPGIAQVAVDIDAKRVTVDYDPAQAAPAQIDDALQDEGYPPSRA